MRKGSFLVFLLLLSIKFYAQQTHNILGQIEYVRSTDLLDGSELNGPCNLYIGQNESLFIHLNTPEESKIIEDGFSIEKISADKDGFPIYINLESKTYIEKTTISSKEKLCVLEDALAPINWQILEEVKKIGTFKCQKAQGTFRGRKYIVWFTADIPFSGGPHKLHGLPGLILDAKSEDGKVAFSFSKAYLKKESISSNDFAPPTSKLTFNSEVEFVKKEIAIHLALKKSIQSKYPDVQINVECPRGDIRIEKDFYESCVLPINGSY